MNNIFLSFAIITKIIELSLTDIPNGLDPILLVESPKGPDPGHITSNKPYARTKRISIYVHLSEKRSYASMRVVWIGASQPYISF
jgi:hypothetical protein